MIYEVRAYLGKGENLYTCIFATMEAAREEVERLTNGCNLNGVEIIGMIYTLSAVNHKYEPIIEKTVFFDNKKDLAKFYIARDKDGKLFKYPYWAGMCATDIPHKHINAYPFDGNFYVQGRDYQPKKGKEIDGKLYGYVIYENSPVLITEGD